MKNKPITKICLLASAFWVLGTLINISNPDNVPIGITLMGACAILLLYALIIAIKQIRHADKEREDRVKKLEDDVALLKKQNKNKS